MTDPETLDVIAKLVAATNEDKLLWTWSKATYRDGSLFYTTNINGYRIGFRTGQGSVSGDGISYSGDVEDFTALGEAIKEQQPRFHSINNQQFLGLLNRLT